MSNALAVLPVLEALEVAVKSAWPDVKSIDTDAPLTAEEVPYAVIDWGPVSVNPTGQSASLRRPEQHLSFMVIGVFPIPDGKKPTVEQLDRANALIAVLQAGPSFAGATSPLVTNVDPTKLTSPFEHTCEIEVIFECDVQVDHH